MFKVMLSVDPWCFCIAYGVILGLYFSYNVNFMIHKFKFGLFNGHKLGGLKYATFSCVVIGNQGTVVTLH